MAQAIIIFLIIVITIINIREKNKSEKLFFLIQIFLISEIYFTLQCLRANDIPVLNYLFLSQKHIMNILSANVIFLFIGYLINLLFNNEKAKEIIYKVCEVLGIIFMVIWFIIWRI